MQNNNNQQEQQQAQNESLEAANVNKTQTDIDTDVEEQRGQDLSVEIVHDGAQYGMKKEMKKENKKEWRNQPTAIPEEKWKYVSAVVNNVIEKMGGMNPIKQEIANFFSSGNVAPVELRQGAPGVKIGTVDYGYKTWFSFQDNSMFQEVAFHTDTYHAILNWNKGRMINKNLSVRDYKNLILYIKPALNEDLKRDYPNLYTFYRSVDYALNKHFFLPAA